MKKVQFTLSGVLVTLLLTFKDGRNLIIANFALNKDEHFVLNIYRIPTDSDGVYDPSIEGTYISNHIETFEVTEYERLIITIDYPETGYLLNRRAKSLDILKNCETMRLY